MQDGTVGGRTHDGVTLERQTTGSLGAEAPREANGALIPTTIFLPSL
jgi:hypothetical protein